MKTKKTFSAFEIFIFAVIAFIITCLVICWLNMTPSFGGSYANNINNPKFDHSELQNRV